MISAMDCFPLSCPHRTNVHTPPETKFSQMTVDLLLGHSKQTDYKKIITRIMKKSETIHGLPNISAKQQKIIAFKA